MGFGEEASEDASVDTERRTWREAMVAGEVAFARARRRVRAHARHTKGVFIANQIIVAQCVPRGRLSQCSEAFRRSDVLQTFHMRRAELGQTILLPRIFAKRNNDIPTSCPSSAQSDYLLSFTRCR